MKILLNKFIILFACFLFANDDIDFIFEQLSANHPGMILDENFQETLKNGYEQAKIDGDVEGFLKKFDDPHLTIINNSNSVKSKTKFTIHFTQNKIAIISIPSFFNVDMDYFKELLKTLAEIRKNHVIIFDLRGNRGGCSIYGEQIFAALFGRESFCYYWNLLNKNVEVLWRISKDNVEHVKTFSMFGQEADIMQKHLDQGKAIYIEKSNFRDICEPEKNISSKVYVIIDEFNASAALDFLDLLKISEQCYFVGQDTFYDRVYLETRTVDLPSGKSKLVFPIKAYFSRKRKDKERHMPNFYLREGYVKFILEKEGVKQEEIFFQ